MRLHFTIRDLLWLTVVVALVMWALVERRRAHVQYGEALQAKRKANLAMKNNGLFTPESFYKFPNQD